MYKLNWFYPAFMIIVGAHYLPFVFLYGMRLFAFLAALLIGVGLLIGLNFAGSFTLGGWVTAGMLLICAPLFGYSVAREELGKASHF